MPTEPSGFMAVVRAVADARHVSVHEILSPPLQQTFGYLPPWDFRVPILLFDPYDGWSWREVLAWFADAVRQNRTQEQQREEAEWRDQAKKRLSGLGES